MRYSGFFRRGEHPHHHHHHLRRVRHNKWLAFRALTGKVEERFQNQRHEEQGSKGGKPLAHLALGLAMSTVVVLCALSDRPFAHNLPLQGMLQACFCLVAAVLYAIYMIMSRMLHFILTNSQEDSLSRSPYPSPDEDFLEDEQDNNNNSSSSRNEEEEAVTETQTESAAAAAEAAVVAPKKRRKRESLQHINRGTTGEFHWLLSYNDDDNEDEDDDHDVEEEDITDTSALLSRAGVPREVVISSMYMGGSGAFLAIQPLCMWEIDCSCAFIFALLCISAFTEYTRSRRLLLCSISLTLILALVLIFLSSSTTANTTFNLNTNNITSHHGYNNNINSNIYAAAWMWPRLLLAVASPLLLRAGGGGAGSAFYHSMTSSETLETGLPVSVLLAILVLCWYVFVIWIMRNFLNFDTCAVCAGTAPSKTCSMNPGPRCLCGRLFP